MPISPIPGRTTAPIPSSTLKGYLAEPAATNYALQSNALNTAPWYDIGSPSATQNVTGPNGQANYAWTLTDDNPAVNEAKAQDITLTAATWTSSALVGKTVGAQPSYPILYSYSPVSGLIAICTIDTSNGVATVWTAYTGLVIATGLTARCSSYGPNFWLVELVYTGTATAWQHALIAAGTTNATQSTGAPAAATTGSAVYCDIQTELGAAATSRINTTTLAVTRPADVLSYTGGDIPNLKTLAATFQRAVGVSSVGVVAELHDGTANEDTYVFLSTAANIAFISRDGGSTQWQSNSAVTPTNTYTAGTTRKVAWSSSAANYKADDGGTALTLQVLGSGQGTVNTLGVGCYNNSLFQLNGNVGGIYGWTRNLSQSELAAVDR